MKNLVLQIVAFLALAPLCRGYQGEASLQVESPTEGQVFRGERMHFRAKVLGELQVRHVVRLQVFGQTHHLVAEPGASHRHNDIWSQIVSDGYLKQPLGEHTMRVQLFREGRDEALAAKTVRFRIEEADPEQLRAQLHDCSGGIANTRINLRSARRSVLVQSLESNEAFHARRGNWFPGIVKAECNHWHQRINTYAEAAKLYHNACLPERAAAALTMAEEIYREGAERVLNHPQHPPTRILYELDSFTWSPRHFRELAATSVRKGKLGEAERWMLEQANWYRDQAQVRSGNADIVKRCNASRASAYEAIAELHYLLAQDLVQYVAWRKKAASLLPETGSGGLLGH